MVELALTRSKLLELPVANAKQDTVEEDDFGEPVNAHVESLLVRDSIVDWSFLVLAVSIICAILTSVLQEALHFVSGVSHRGKKLEADGVGLSILEVADDDVVDGSEGGTHDHDAESDDWNGHCFAS